MKFGIIFNSPLLNKLELWIFYVLPKENDTEIDTVHRLHFQDHDRVHVQKGIV